MHFSRYTAGYSLVETLVAISVLMIALVGPITIAAKSLQSSFFAREQVTALYLAQEGIEAITALRNDHYITILDGDLTNGELLDGTTLPGEWIQAFLGGGPSKPFSDCRVNNFNQSGCNFTVQNGVVIDNEKCNGSTSSCTMEENSDGFLLYEADGSGPATKYRREIKVLPDTSSGLVDVEVTVSWSSSLFPSGDSDVVLKTTVVDYLQYF